MRLKEIVDNTIVELDFKTNAGMDGNRQKKPVKFSAKSPEVLQMQRRLLQTIDKFDSKKLILQHMIKTIKMSDLQLTCKDTNPHLFLPFIPTSLTGNQMGDNKPGKQT